jgi:hypothetical protein
VGGRDSIGLLSHGAPEGTPLQSPRRPLVHCRRCPLRPCAVLVGAAARNTRARPFLSSFCSAAGCMCSGHPCPTSSLGAIRVLAAEGACRGTGVAGTLRSRQCLRVQSSARWHHVKGGAVLRWCDGRPSWWVRGVYTPFRPRRPGTQDACVRPVAAGRMGVRRAQPPASATRGAATWGGVWQNPTPRVYAMLMVLLDLIITACGNGAGLCCGHADPW